MSIAFTSWLQWRVNFIHNRKSFFLVATAVAANDDDDAITCYACTHKFWYTWFGPLCTRCDQDVSLKQAAFFERMDKFYSNFYCARNLLYMLSHSFSRRWFRNGNLSLEVVYNLPSLLRHHVFRRVNKLSHIAQVRIERECIACVTHIRV